MGAQTNDAILSAMAALMPLGARVQDALVRRRIAGFQDAQRGLRDAYGIRPDTPIRGYDDDTRARVRALVQQDPGARIATTSGSTGAPKELAYPRDRLRLYKRDAVSLGVRTFAHLRLARPSLFILAGLKPDDSFASLVLHTQGTMPPYFAALVEPSRMLAHPRLAALVAEHGANAVRLWLLTVSNPGLLYATNPSTLAVFFTDLHDRWQQARVVVERFVRGDLQRDRDLLRIAARVGTQDAPARLQRICDSDEPLPVEAWLPGLAAYVTWDGGYVTAFLPEVRRHLPAERVRHVPLYSMSTETIETLPVFVDPPDPQDPIAFLPLGPRVLYELLPVTDNDDDDSDRPMDPALLRRPHGAVPGALYTLVVSDPWGLVRYQTDDVFLCKRVIDGLPDLRFVRRRGLAWSFTGEKLTGEQLRAAYRVLRDRFPALSHGVELACFPSHPDTSELPGYVLVLAPTSDDGQRAAAALDRAALADALDALLQEANAELRDKRKSGRLAAFSVDVIPYDTLAALLDRRTTSPADEQLRPWESQFKLNPLMKTRFEDVRGRA